VKKIIVGVAVSILVIGLFAIVARSGTLKSQTSSQPTSSGTTSSTPVPSTNTPSTTTPAAPAPSTAVRVNRPVSRWLTTNLTMLNTLITDSKQLETYISNMQLGYAEETCVQVRCDINTMRGVPPPETTTDTYYYPPGEIVINVPEERSNMVTNTSIPRNWLMWERLSYQKYFRRWLGGVPSGVECPPIPDAQAAVDLNAGLNQLEITVNHMVNGINDSQEGLLLGLEAELQAANQTLEKVLTDLGNASGAQ